jgi:hypothetical protein
VAVITNGVGGRARHDLTNEIDDSVAPCSEPADDLKLFGSVHVYDGGSENTGADGLALKEQILTNEVTGCENILDEGRDRGNCVDTVATGKRKRDR